MGCIERGATQCAALVHPLLSLPVQGPPLLHWSLVPNSLAASSKLPAGFCGGSADPWTSTLPAESITTSDDRARAVRAATTDVAAPTASAAFSNNPRRLTPSSFLGFSDIARPHVGRMFKTSEDRPSVQAARGRAGLLAAVTAGRIQFWSREWGIRFGSGAHGLHRAGSDAIACIAAAFVAAAGAVAFIRTLIVGSHQLGRFVETALRPLSGKGGPLDEHPAGGVHHHVRRSCQGRSRRDHRCRRTDRECCFFQYSTPADAGIAITFGVPGHCAPPRWLDVQTSEHCPSVQAAGPSARYS
jgi:hypothetical protein